MHNIYELLGSSIATNHPLFGSWIPWRSLVRWRIWLHLLQPWWWRQVTNKTTWPFGSSKWWVSYPPEVFFSEWKGFPGSPNRKPDRFPTTMAFRGELLNFRGVRVISEFHFLSWVAPRKTQKKQRDLPTFCSLNLLPNLDIDLGPCFAPKSTFNTWINDFKQKFSRRWVHDLGQEPSAFHASHLSGQYSFDWHASGSKSAITKTGIPHPLKAYVL